MQQYAAEIRLLIRNTIVILAAFVIFGITVPFGF
jgi:hypothetical protein